MTFRVAQPSTTTGTGSITVSGTLAGYAAFTTEVTTIVIEAIDSVGRPTGQWEVCDTVFTSGPNTLTRGTLRASSTGSRIDFAEGTKRVFAIVLAAPAVSPTLTGAIATNGSVRQTATAVGASDIDCSAGNYFTRTVAGNVTFTFSNPPASGTAYAFTLKITHTSGTITWPATVRWPGNTAPTLTTGRTHQITFVTDDGGANWIVAPQVNYVV